MSHSPEKDVLGRIRWQLFATLTFRPGLESRVAICKRLLFAWLRSSASFTGGFKRLVWVVRAERGELGGRFHLHVLLAGLPIETKQRGCLSWSFFCIAEWKRLTGSRVTVQPFDPSLSGVQYVLKGMGAGASYEMRKFHLQSCDLMLSESIRSIVRRGCNVGDRSAGKAVQC